MQTMVKLKEQKLLLEVKKLINSRSLYNCLFYNNMLRYYKLSYVYNNIQLVNVRLKGWVKRMV